LASRRRKREDQFVDLVVFSLALSAIFYIALKCGIDEVFLWGMAVGFLVAFLWRPVYCRVVPALRRVARTRRRFIVKALLSTFVFMFTPFLTPVLIIVPLEIVLPMRAAVLATLVAVAEFGLRGALGREMRFDQVWKAGGR